MQTLSIAVIRTDGGTQPRAHINMTTVAEYAEDMAREAAFPPVVVFFDGSAYWLADGFHRYHAALSLGLATLDADVRRGTLAEAQWYSYSVNQSHGLRRTNEDKRRAVEAALQHPYAASKSLRDIANHCGVHWTTVENYRNASVENLQINNERTVTRAGTTYTMNTANIGRREETEPQPQIEWQVAPEPLDDDTILAMSREIMRERSEQRRAERIERITTISQNNGDLDGIGPFNVIYADPPWRYEYIETESRAIENQYPTMTLDAICALPVGDIAADDCVLLMWATSPKLAEAMQVLEAWGFNYRTCMVWVKDKIGMGYYARQQHELLLIAARGELPTPLPENRPSSVFYGERTEHSRKPETAYELVERMYPEYKRVELFARNKRDGWQTWGNQA